MIVRCGKSITSTTYIPIFTSCQWTNMGTEPLLTFTTTCNIIETSFHWDELQIGMDVFVCIQWASSMTREMMMGRRWWLDTTVENVLDWQFYIGSRWRTQLPQWELHIATVIIITTRLSSCIQIATIDFDPICQWTHCRMCPTASTILRYVLIAHPSKVRVPIDILPCECLR